MASDKSGLGVLLGFIGALIVFLTSLVSFGITADVAFYIYAVEDDSLWTDELKYVNASADTSNTYGVDDANIKDIYEAALDARTDNIGYLTTMITAANLVVTLISLVIVVGLFFRKGDGILSQLRGMSQ
jgi:predicted PurR-regulated permease PerM